MTYLDEFIPLSNMRMSVMYFLLCYMCITISPVYAAKVVNISYTSLGSPDFYLNDEFTFTCTATGFSDIQYLYLYYDGIMRPVYGRSGCSYDRDDKKWGSRGAPFIGNADGVDSPPTTTAYCESVGKAEGFNISVKVTITDAGVGGYFYCRASDGISRTVYVTSVKVAPVNLIMSVPEEVVEGEEFEVKCESTGADPVSSYKYEILRGSTAVATGSTYTSTKDDRGGITFTCTDTAHPNWRGGSTELSKEILPKYIDIVEESNIYAELNPQYSALELNCSNYVTGNPLPDTFRWAGNGWLLETSSTLISILRKGGRKGGVEETVKCTAENGIGKNVTVSWNITWRSDVTTIPTTTPRDTPATCNKTPVAAIVGGVVGGAAILIIIIIISVYCWRNKNDQMKRQAPADAVTSDYTELAGRREGHEYAAVQPQPTVNRINDAAQISSSPNYANVLPVTDARNQNYHGHTDDSRIDGEDAYEQLS